MRTSMCLLVAAVLSGSQAMAQFTEKFDTYTTGSTIAGQGGWGIWYSGGTDGIVSGTHFSSSPNSLRLNLGSDIVHLFSGSDDGNWIFSVDTFVPTDGAGNGYVILMNQYGSTAVDNWSTQVRLGATDNRVESQWDLASVPLIKGQWVEVRVEISLTNDVYNVYYGDQLVECGLDWTGNVSGGTAGITSIACVDLYSESTDEIYFDNVVLEEGGDPQCSACDPCDTNCDGSINLFDIDPFVTILSNGGGGCAPCSGDANADGSINLFDIDPFVGCIAG